MKVKKDAHLDVAYVELRKGTVAETVEIRPGMLVDLDKNGNILGIEVLSMKKMAPLLEKRIKKSAPKHTSLTKR